MPTTLDRDQMLRLARLGAEARIAQLRREIASIATAFPELAEGAGGVERARGGEKRARGGRGRARGRTSSGRVANAAADMRGTEEPRKPGRRMWTEAQRQEAAERMRAYWAARGKGGGGTRKRGRAR